MTNLVNVSLFLHTAVELLRGGQVSISPLLVGGSVQRNQIVHQTMRVAGQTQNNNYVLKIKIPRHLQRIREGDVFNFLFNGSAVFSEAAQIIYKFYR